MEEKKIQNTLELPKELWWTIFLLLPSSQLRNVLLANRYLKSMVYEYGERFKKIYEQEFKGDYLYRLQTKPPIYKWRKFFKQTERALVENREIIDNFQLSDDVSLNLKNLFKKNENNECNIINNIFMLLSSLPTKVVLVNVGQSRVNKTFVSYLLINDLFFQYSLKKNTQEILNIIYGYRNSINEKYGNKDFYKRIVDELHHSRNLNERRLKTEIEWGMICRQSADEILRIINSLPKNSELLEASIYYAIHFNHYAIFPKLYAMLTLPNTTLQPFLNRCLKIAMRFRTLEIASFLIKEGASIYNQFDWSVEPLLFVVKKKFYHGLKLLLKAGCIFDLFTADNSLILHSVIDNGSIDICRLLLKKKFNLNYCYYSNNTEVRRLVLYNLYARMKKMTFEQAHVLQMLIHAGLNIIHNEVSIIKVINNLENLPNFLVDIVVEGVMDQALKARHQPILTCLSKKLQQSTKYNFDTDGVKLSIIQNEISKWENNLFKKDISNAAIKNLSLAEIDDIYGIENRSNFLLENHKNFHYFILNDHCFDYLKAKSNLIGIIEKYNKFLEKYEAYKNREIIKLNIPSYVEFLFYNDGYLQDKDIENNSCKLHIYYFLGMHITQLKSSQMKKIHDFLESDYFNYLEKNVFSILTNEIHRLKSENDGTVNNVLSGKIKILTNEKKNLLNIIAFNLLQDNYNIHKIHSSLCRKLQDLCQQHDLHVYHKPLQGIFKTILGFLLNCITLFIPYYYSESYRNFFFKTPTYCRMVETQHFMQSAYHYV
jgi:hypothetical protein